MRLDLVFLVGRSTSGGVFWGVCGLIMILGILSANGWCCVPVLLVVWQRVSNTVVCLSLSGAGSWRWSGDLWEIFTVWYYMELGGLLWTSVLNLILPPQRHSPAAWLEQQEVVIHMACTQGFGLLSGSLWFLHRMVHSLLAFVSTMLIKLWSPEVGSVSTNPVSLDSLNTVTSSEHSTAGFMEVLQRVSGSRQSWDTC